MQCKHEVVWYEKSVQYREVSRRDLYGWLGLSVIMFFPVRN